MPYRRPSSALPGRTRPRPSRRRSVGLLAGVVAAGAGLSACSSSTPAAARRTGSSAATGHRRGHHHATTTSAATTSVPPTTAATTPTTAPAGGPGGCSSGVLALHEAGVDAAAGTSHLTFDLENQGPRTCTMEGYPTIRFFGGSGAGGAGAGTKLAVRDIELGSSPKRVTLSSRATASFVLSVSEVPVNGVGCDRVASLQVVPPGGAAALSIPAAFQVCGGTIGVYPVGAGS